MEIKIDNLLGSEVAQLLQEHIDDMKSVSPPESKHALDLDGLRKPSVTFWTVWDGENLAGCGAIQELDGTHGEIKSMRTSSKYVRKGVAHRLMKHIINVSRERGYTRLSLETGSMAYFEPARALYRKYGFEYCAPFGSYKEDPNSIFMSKGL